MTITAADQTIAGYYDSVSGKVHTGTRMKFAQNLGWYNYWSGAFPFINVIKGGFIIFSNANPGNLDANGYPNISSGGGYQCITHAIVARWMQEGTASVPWVLRWTGTATNVTWNGGTEEASSTNRREYSSPAVPTGSYFVSVSGPGTCTNVELLAPGEETRYDAGNILHSTFVSDLSGLSIARMMDWQDMSGSIVRDYTDINTYDALNWTLKTDNTEVDRGIPIQALCEAANELGADPWICMYHKATDACATSVATDIAAHLDIAGGRRALIEIGNEIWHNQSPWSDGRQWFENEDATPRTASVVPATSVCTETTHGMNFGDEVKLFSNIIANTAWYTYGNTWYVIVIDANTFKLGRGLHSSKIPPQNITAITKANPAVATVANHGYANGSLVGIFGADMTEVNDIEFTIGNITTNTFELTGIDSSAYTAYTTGGKTIQAQNPIASTVTSILYKRVADSSDSRATGLARRSQEMWDLCEAQIGAGNMDRVGSGFTGLVSVLNDLLAEPGYREAIDYYSIAPYFDTYTIASDYENYTNTEHTDYAIATTIVNMAAAVSTHIEALGSNRIIFYESGEHNGGQSGISAAKQAKCLSWAADVTELARAYSNYCETMADLSVPILAHYTSHRPVDASGTSGNTFGSQKHLGDTSYAKYLAVEPYLDNGGVPKS